MSHGFKIGELAARCGVSRDALRFYERVGLLDPPQRTASGHRVYGDEAVQRMELIRWSQQLGLTLVDIRELLQAQKLPAREAGERIAERLGARMEVIDQQISTLRTHRRRLAEALEICRDAGADPGPLLLRLQRAALPDEQKRD